MLIEGARRVGKSTIVKHFAENEFKSYILIDFLEASSTVKDLIERNSDNLDRLMLLLSTTCTPG